MIACFTLFVYRMKRYVEIKIYTFQVKQGRRVPAQDVLRQRGSRGQIHIAGMSADGQDMHVYTPSLRMISKRRLT